MKHIKERIFHPYGIQKRFLSYMMLLFMTALIISSIGIGIVVSKNVKKNTIETYEYANEKLSIALDSIYKETDEITQKYITNSDVQKSLLNSPLSTLERNSLVQILSYMNVKRMSNYIYIDNKENFYSQQYLKFNYKSFQQSNLYSALGTSYSKTQWIWSQDSIFGTKEKALFVGRYIRPLEYSHEPGLLYLKMDIGIFYDILNNIQTQEKAAYFFLDKNSEICYKQLPVGYEFSINKKNQIQNAVSKGIIVPTNQEEMKTRVVKTAGGYLCSTYHNKSGFTVATLIPNQVINQVLFKILLIILAVFATITYLAFVFSIYFSKRLIKPIKQISEAMSSFDGTDFNNTLNIYTNTELDTIGLSYNKMLNNIEVLMNEITLQQKQLRTSELQSLIYQINPHFLYNTLDTIYMLARINKEETTMVMIQSLSRFLRISLSKGNEEILVLEELEHVQSYMDIQKIRNNNLFLYEIHCDSHLKNLPILKLILQPLVENAVKYGFCEIYEGGLIEIHVYEEEHYFILSIYNNGIPITKDALNQINQMAYMDLKDITSVFQQEKGGYGVGNVVSRLRLRYGDTIAFYYEALEDGTMCYIKIPRSKLEEGGNH